MACSWCPLLRAPSGVGMRDSGVWDVGFRVWLVGDTLWHVSRCEQARWGPSPGPLDSHWPPRFAFLCRVLVSVACTCTCPARRHRGERGGAWGRLFFVVACVFLGLCRCVFFVFGVCLFCRWCLGASRSRNPGGTCIDLYMYTNLSIYVWRGSRWSPHT